MASGGGSRTPTPRGDPRVAVPGQRALDAIPGRRLRGPGDNAKLGYGAADGCYFQPYVDYRAAIGVNRSDVNPDVHPAEVRVVAATSEDHTVQAGNCQHLAFRVFGRGRPGLRLWDGRALLRHAPE